MPELPEVRTVVQFLKTNLVGKTIDDFQLFYRPLLLNLKDSDDAGKDLTHFKEELHGQTIEDIFPYGKYIIFQLNDATMISHLRMEGKWVFEERNVSAYNPELIEAQFSFEGQKKVLRYYDSRRFGTLQITKKDEWSELPAIAKLGYEPFNPLATPEWLYERLQHSRKPIKTVLLDQTVILGLGNIYANEVLFAAKINPNRPANQITLGEAATILAASKKILSDSIKVGGTTIHSFAFGDKQTGGYQKFLQVHGRAGQKCFVCGTKIEKNVINGRGTYYCPNCQAK